MKLRTAALIALLSSLAVLVALRRREPDRAVMRRRAAAKREWQRGATWGRWVLDDDDVQPDDPYPPGLLR